ncbi:hemin uptake protein HemP [Planctomicrobium sp. SH668]|uniref:hemin uptake protein HemP n=1 Tax=Planctomicrobium sp. SH668 TaxID=3448126 RepID=UPI003F5CB15D
MACYDHRPTAKSLGNRLDQGNESLCRIDTIVNEPSPHPNHSRIDQPVHKQTGLDCIDSSAIFKNGREVLIKHGEETYRLRLTKSGKLILHK